MPEVPPLEVSTSRATMWALPAVAVGALGLLVPQPAGETLLPAFLIQLAALVALGLIVTWDLSPGLPEIWRRERIGAGGRLAAAAVIVSLVTGVVALVTLASSAALRLDPSLQFLQLLSALDIAWAAAATTIGVTWLWGRRPGLFAGTFVLVVCVWSIWRYLAAVGFSDTDGWLVDGAALMRYVLPYDMLAAAAAITLLILGARKEAGRINSTSVSRRSSVD